MTNDGGMRCCDGGHCDCHQTEYRGWWTRQTVSRRTGDILANANTRSAAESVIAQLKTLSGPLGIILAMLGINLYFN